VKLGLAYLRSGKRSSLVSLKRLLRATALAGIVLAPVLPALAQVANPLAQQLSTSFNAVPSLAPGGQMLLEADQLTYDFDRQRVTATGNVQIHYGALVLDAEKLTYDQRSGRLIASGGVRILEPGGNLIVAETLDVTDDFSDGFIESINLITTDRVRLTAQAAERRDGNLLIFRRGVYTACEPCAEHPEKPPLWQIKAARIVQDSAEKTIYYQHARLEFFGIPIAYTPFFSHPDPSVKRKSGFLTPSLLQTDAIGVGVTTPYFWNLAPNYDLTLSPPC
jgi:LPS-assembly protein